MGRSPWIAVILLIIKCILIIACFSLIKLFIAIICAQCNDTNSLTFNKPLDFFGPNGQIGAYKTQLQVLNESCSQQLGVVLNNTGTISRKDNLCNH